MRRKRKPIYALALKRRDCETMRKAAPFIESLSGDKFRTLQKREIKDTRRVCGPNRDMEIIAAIETRSVQNFRVQNHEDEAYSLSLANCVNNVIR